MKVEPNIGIINALLRITSGLTVLSWATARLAKRPWRSGYLWVAMMGALKVAEGIVRYCPITAMMKEMPLEQWKEKAAKRIPIENNPSCRCETHREMG